MAEAFIQVVLDNLTSFLKGELVLLFGFQDEFQRLSSMFSTIQAVLEDAQEKQLNDKPLENWLQKLNAATYEVDDILDEYKTKATRFLQSEYGRYHPKVIPFRHKVGKRMDQVMKKLNAIAEERKKFHLQEKIIERQAATRETGSVLTEPQVYGRDKEKDEIVKILINTASDAQKLSVLPILGMGGLGKTTLSQMVFNDQRVTERFYPKIWICISDDFNEKRLIKAIVESIEGKSLSDMDLAPLQKKLQELLNGKRYFLVLDDVWNEDQHKWANLRAVLKVGASGAFVLTTTRLEKVGSIMGTLQPYELSNLSPEDCWFLFMQRAFGHQEEINPNLMAIGKEIVKKCGGVPLAAKTLGGILRFKREEREWEHVRDSPIWNLPQDESSILPALRLSYHHLPLDLRQCFVYCAVFPKDTKMAKENLIAFWMAHGFLLSKGNLELEDVGNEVWNELYLRSFFQEIEVESGKTYFKMHDLIHDLATSLFSANTSSSNIREINANYDGYMMSIGFAEVVSSYSPSLLQKFVSLRVLNLRNSNLNQLPSSIGDLVHLRYLDLSGNFRIRNLPKRLCKLQNLQTLDLHYCDSLSCLPKQTSKLGSLRNLLLDGCSLTSTPPRIGLLTCLKSLSCFVIGKRKGHQLGELKNLNLYGSISITKLDRVKKDTDAKEANLSAKANLHSLCLSWDLDGKHRYDSEVLEALKPHSNLKYLEINGFGGIRLPDWMNQSVLKNVVSIRIRGCENCSCLPPFGELPCLESLELHTGSADVEYVEDNVHPGRFPSLRKLVIWDFSNLKGLLKMEGEKQFPVLEEMTFYWCPMFVIPTLSSVKTLKVIVTDATVLRSISNLRALTSLDISDNVEATSLPEEMFKSLANLKYLKISFFRNLKELPTSLASLNALKSLKFEFCDALESLPEEGVKGLTSLTELSVSNCMMLKCLPEGLQHLTALTTLTITQCPIVFKRCERGIGEDWHKIAHIPYLTLYE
uniref:Putative disease resistance protein RGA1 n=1 Tax=Solanum bulbocastanum TaxID=147425 RepID=RGA1_SOLBU|nr:RecName: Full=Putative disease resistance protein RGA1; AltName: Full=RGA3-blb [Solanum bulbocastanum]AAP45163.2 Disease resistance protein RGA1, putative [Solanum bulbocastanum]